MSSFRNLILGEVLGVAVVVRDEVEHLARVLATVDVRDLADEGLSIHFPHNGFTEERVNRLRVKRDVDNLLMRNLANVHLIHILIRILDRTAERNALAVVSNGTSIVTCIAFVFFIS